MDFALNDQQQMIASMLAAFFAKHVTDERRRRGMAANGFDADVWSAYCQELQFAGLTVPEEAGGAGLGFVELALVAEASGKVLAPIPLLGHSMATAALLASGDCEAIERSLPAMMAGTTIAVAAEYRPDGLLVPHGAVADIVVLLHPDEARVVHIANDGACIIVCHALDQTRPLARLNARGGHALHGGITPVIAARQAGLLFLAAEALGGAQEALDRTVSFVKERHQFGRPVGSFQAIKHRLADRAVELEQARSAVLWAASALDNRSEDVELALHAAKSVCGDAFMHCANDMIQFHGGIGFTWEHEAHLFFKRARAVVNLLGDSAHHREQVARLTLDRAA